MKFAFTSFTVIHLEPVGLLWRSPLLSIQVGVIYLATRTCQSVRTWQQTPHLIWFDCNLLQSLGIRERASLEELEKEKFGKVRKNAHQHLKLSKPVWTVVCFRIGWWLMSSKIIWKLTFYRRSRDINLLKTPLIKFK